MPAKIAGGIFLANALMAAWAATDQPRMSFIVYSDPIELRYGEVYNKAQTEGGFAAHLLPKEVIERYASGEKDMAIRNFTMDMVRIAEDGTETSVKLSDHYLHHYILHFGKGDALQELLIKADKDPHLKMMLTGCHGMRGKGAMLFKEHLARSGRDPHVVTFGSAAGAEYRHNPQGFLSSFALIIRKPEAFMPTYHIINTKNDESTVSRLLECPCTPQRKINVENGTIDGHEPHPPFKCSDNFAATGNPSCNLSTYVGGWRCCEHGVSVIDTDKECANPSCTDKPKDRIFMKFRFEYEDSSPESRDVEPGACCDTTSDRIGFGNIEHDVPACKKDDADCLYTTESVQPIAYYWDWPSSPKRKSDFVDLVFAAPHLHWAGIYSELIDAVTNKTLCKMEHNKAGDGGVMYGTGDEAGNEKGYLVGLSACKWTSETAPRFRRDHPIRSRAVYNASTYHTGAMSLWLLSVSAVQGNASVNHQFLV